MEKKKYLNPTMEEIEVKEQLLADSPTNPDGPGSDENPSRSASSFSDAE